MDESVVEGGKKMNNSEVVNILGCTSLRWSEIGNLLFFFNFLILFWWLKEKKVLRVFLFYTYHLVNKK
jgi:hypothetical protein